MSRSILLGKLDRATDRAVSIAFQREIPMNVTKTATVVGNCSIEKNDDGTYNVLGFDRLPVYENITVFDVAIIVAQRYNSHETGVIKKVLFLEERFAKYHTDMIHYLHCMKAAKKKQDPDRMAILEDKFHVAEQCAKDARDQISVFKRVK